MLQQGKESNHQRLKKILNDTRPKVIETISNILINTIHNRYTKNYLSIILDDFIDEYCSIVIDRYTRLSKRVPQQPDFKIKVDSTSYPKHIHIWPENVLNSCCYSRSTNKFILDSLKKNQNINKIFKDLELKNSQPGLKTRMLSSARCQFNNVANRVTSAYEPQVLLCNTGISRRKLLKTFALSKGKMLPLFVTRPAVRTEKINTEARRIFTDYTCSNIIVQAVVSTLGLNMPACFIEAFDSFRTAIKSQIGSIKPRQRVVFGGLRLPSYRICLAECVKSGAEILGLQTGGLLGEGFYKIEERMRRATHRFVTWGWQREPSDIPLPSLHLADTVQSARCSHSTESILWISREPASIEPQERFGYGIPSSPRLSTHGYRKNQNNLYMNIDNKLKQKIIFRPKPVMLTKAFIEKQQMRFKLAEIDGSNKDFLDLVASAKLVVIDYFGATPFLELLAINKPVLLLSDLPKSDNGICGITDIAFPLYAQLSDVDVFHHCPVSAANTVNKVYNNVDAWWSQPNRKDAINDFASTFALTHSKSTKVFANRLCNLQSHY